MITEGVTPSLHIDYKHATIKQYHKEGRALADRDHDQRHPRLRDRQTADQSARPAGDRPLRQPTPARRPNDSATTRSPQPEAFTAVTGPVSPTPAPAFPGCAWPDHRAHALLQALLMFRLLPSGFANRDLRAHRRVAADCPAHHRRADELRPATTARPRTDHPHPAQPPLPPHRRRPAHAMMLTRLHTACSCARLAHLTDPGPPATAAHRRPHYQTSPRRTSSTTPDSPPDHRPGPPSNLTRSSRLRRP